MIWCRSHCVRQMLWVENYFSCACVCFCDVFRIVCYYRREADYFSVNVFLWFNTFQNFRLIFFQKSCEIKFITNIGFFLLSFMFHRICLDYSFTTEKCYQQGAVTFSTWKCNYGKESPHWISSENICIWPRLGSNEQQRQCYAIWL